MNTFVHGFSLSRVGRLFLMSIVLTILFFGSAPISLTQAEELFITDDYLRGLDAEVSDPAYLEKARQELRDTEKREKTENSTADVRKALISSYNFETLLRTKYPSSYTVYSKLPTSARILIYDEFKNTKKLSTAKRLIIERFEAQ